MCDCARDILKGEHNVGRVIARPFIVENGIYTRTERRRDFSLLPPEETMLDKAVKKGYEVVGVGKIGDIFAHRGLTREIHASNNRDGVLKTIESIREDFKGIIFTNLIDFDMKYGHRNNPEGYAEALESFDKSLPEIVDALKAGDVIIITADHGCDPTTLSTDHSREYVPLLVFGKKLNKPGSLGIRNSFADIGATVSEALLESKLDKGESFFTLTDYYLSIADSNFDKGYYKKALMYYNKAKDVNKNRLKEEIINSKLKIFNEFQES